MLLAHYLNCTFPEPGWLVVAYIEAIRRFFTAFNLLLQKLAAGHHLFSGDSSLTFCLDSSFHERRVVALYVWPWRRLVVNILPLLLILLYLLRVLCYFFKSSPSCDSIGSISCHKTPNSPQKHTNCYK